MDVLKSDTFWSAISAIFTAIGALGILFAVRQFRFDALLRAHDLFNTDDFAAARRRVFERLDSPPRPFTDNEREQAMSVLRRLDEFGRLASYVGKRRMLRIWGDPLAKAWLVLGPIVQDERVKTHWPDKWETFERLATDALKKRKDLRRLPGAPRATPNEG